MVRKVLFGFLVGFILGAIGTGFLVTSGAGNYLIAANPRVQELESKIREAEDQRAFVTRRLEEVARLSEKMATRFEELSDRFVLLERAQRDATGAAQAPVVNATPIPPPEAAERAPDAGE